MATPSVPGLTKAPSWWDPQHPFIPDVPAPTPGALSTVAGVMGSSGNPAQYVAPHDVYTPTAANPLINLAGPNPAKLVGPANTAIYQLPDGRYYVPASSSVASGGTMSLTPEQAAAHGGVLSGDVGGAPGYVFSANPSSWATPESGAATYTPGTGSGFKSDMMTLAPLALPFIVPALAGALGATAGGAAAAGGGAAAGGAGGLAAGTGLSAAEMAALGGLELPAGLAASGAGAAGGLAGAAGGLGSALTADELAATGGLSIPAGTAASGAAPLGAAGLGAGGADAGLTMAGADALTSGATGGLSAAGAVPAATSGGLSGALQWALAHPQLIAGGIGALGSLIGKATGGGSSGSGSGAAGGTPAAGKPLPYVAPLSRTVTPFTGDQLKYGQASQTGGEHNFFGAAPNVIPHASGGALPSRHATGPGGGRDDMIDAKVADGEFIFSSDVVSALGDGSNDEGAKRLEEAVRKIRARRNAGGTKLPPKAKSPLDYMRTR